MGLSLTILTTADMADWTMTVVEAVGIHVEGVPVSTEDANTLITDIITAAQPALSLTGW